jgi:hypothetical protein
VELFTFQFCLNALTFDFIDLIFLIFCVIAYYIVLLEFFKGLG